MTPKKAEIARKGGLAGAVAGFMQAVSWGMPDKILRGLEERRKTIGDFELNVAFRFGGTAYEVAERGACQRKCCLCQVAIRDRVAAE